jgi:hypothetical protein
VTHWVNVWGREKGSPVVELLFSFPAWQWDEKFSAEVLKTMQDAGVEDVCVEPIEKGER